MLVAWALGYLEDRVCLLLNSEQSQRDYKSGAIDKCNSTDTSENTE